MHSCFKCLAHPSRWMAGLSVLYISFIFLLFMGKFKILLPFFFEAFWIDNHVFDYVKDEIYSKDEFAFEY